MTEGLPPIDIARLILNKLDSFDSKIDDLCDRTTRTEEKIANHFENLKTEGEKRDRNIKLGFSVIGVVFGVYAIIQQFLV